MTQHALLVATGIVAALLAGPAAVAEHVPISEIQWACGFGGSGQRGHPDDCGINAIDQPLFEGDDWLRGDDRVLGVVIDGDTRAYPVKMLNSHEIVNDVVGGVPVAVTFCPLCGSGVTFERTLQLTDGDQEVVTMFEASGFLYRHDLVMHDRATGTLWTQIQGTAIASLEGDRVRAPHLEHRLEVVPTQVMDWSAWKEEHPDTLLLQPQRTSYPDPYASRGYYGSCDFGISGSGECDVRGLHPKERVVGVADPETGDARAWPLFGVLGVGGVVADEEALGGRTVVVAAEPSGAVQVFDGGQRSFAADEAGFWLDDQGAAWDLRTGRSLDGGAALPLLDSMVLFWFAWEQHHETTTLWQPPEGTEGARDLEDNGKLPGFTIGIVAVLLLSTAILRRRRGVP
ncbi:MAG: DUF3179 domain-containing (seleno)protein [Thermoplasmatota archaeon]